jgi:P63C domain
MKKNESKAIGGLARAEKLSPERRSEIARNAALARHESNRVLTAIGRGNFKDELGLDIECYVLDDNNKTAVMSQRGMGEIFGLTGGGGTAFARFSSGQMIGEYLGPELLEKINNPIIFQRFKAAPKDKENGNTKGYDVAILIDVCNAIIKAEGDGKLKQNQLALAKQANIIVGASAKSGIKGLVYALAGYRPEVQEVIQAFKAFVQAEAKKYEAEFPDELYIEWARLYGHRKQRSWKDMHLTINHIYYPLAKSDGNLLTLLRDAKASAGDRNAKLFQFLNLVGARALRFQLGRVFDVAQSALTSEAYEAEISKRFGGQQLLNFSNV